jgi:ubiquinone biosynthesis protein UbiJ
VTHTLPAGGLPLAALEIALNHLLALDPPTLDRLAALDGRVIAVELPALGLALAVAPRRHGVQLLYPPPVQADAHIRGRLADLLQAQADGSTRGLDIDGDKQLASAFAAALREARIDWPQLLAFLPGDVVADRAAQALAAAGQAVRDGARSAVQGGAEFLQYEQPVLVSANEWDSFRGELRELNAAVGVLERRLALLALRLQ